MNRTGTLHGCGARTGQPINLRLRLPPGLHAELKRLAEAGGHSLNSEIIERLNANLGLALSPLEERVSRLEAIFRQGE
jgi:hypothetical protein